MFTLQENIYPSDPHAQQAIIRAGPAIEQAKAVVIMLHGRGSTAQSILSLHNELATSDVAAIAPQAANYTWYPHSFLAPIESNQPFLDSALRRVDGIVMDLLNRGLQSEAIAIIGFSQGACLASEYASRHPRKYGAVVAFTGGLIGPPGTRRNYPGSLAGTPVFLGTSDPDPHVPFERVAETAAVFKNMEAEVDLRRYAGMGHTINEEELEAARSLVQRMIASTKMPPR